MITGDLFRVSHFPWGFYLYMALSGIVHFALGRTWTYRSIQLIGATRSNIVISLNPIVTVILGMIVLRETVTPIMVVGIVCTLMSPLVVLVTEPPVSGDALSGVTTPGKELDRPHPLQRVPLWNRWFPFLGEQCHFHKAWPGGRRIPDRREPHRLSVCFHRHPPVCNHEQRLSRGQLLHGDKNSLRIALFSGLITNIAQLMRYIAIGLGSAIVVSLMLRTGPLWDFTTFLHLQPSV